MTAYQKVISALERAGARSRDGGKTWTCPAHDDQTPSLSLGQGDLGALVHCHVGCAPDAVLAALGLQPRDLFDEPRRGKANGTDATELAREGEDVHPPRNGETVQQSTPGLRLAEYARAKRLPEGLLREHGLRDVRTSGIPCVAIPYRDQNGQEVAVRYRLALSGPDRFRWRKGSKTQPYGLDRVRRHGRGERCLLVEGESDCHTLWSHGIAAVGIPGAGTWRDTWSEALTQFERIYVIVEPDRGGETLRAKLLASPLVERLHIVTLSDAKDASELHMRDPDAFSDAFERELRSAIPAVNLRDRERQESASNAWARCGELASLPNILDRFATDLASAGSVGEERLAKLVYLAVTSRLLEKPVSLAVKGPSSAGKSHTVQITLEFFSPSAFYALTAMSERALAYSTEPLAHRMLVLYEAAGLEGDFASYLVRSLLSEGRLRYETVEKTSEGMRARLIEREGPTGLIVTTTRVRLHPENETRLLSVPVDDTREQTKRILAVLADGAGKPELDRQPWHALQEWLATDARAVEVPFAKVLAALIPPSATRLRRDFSMLLGLIKAHALLHGCTRDRCNDGRIVASVSDYEAVRVLIGDLIAHGVGASVPAAIRETVEAVRSLAEVHADGVSLTALVGKLNLDKSSVSRRARAATDAGFLRNLEERRGRAAQYVVADALPGDLEILPSSERLREVLHGCGVDEGGTNAPPGPGTGAIRELRL